MGLMEVFAACGIGSPGNKDDGPAFLDAAIRRLFHGPYFFNSTVSWGAIAAGSVISCAVSLILAALGIGGGLALVSPWYEHSASATTIAWAAGLGLVCMAII